MFKIPGYFSMVSPSDVQAVHCRGESVYFAIRGRASEARINCGTDEDAQRTFTKIQEIIIPGPKDPYRS